MNHTSQTSNVGQPTPTASGRRVPRQLAAFVWIAVAWLAGTIVFELTAMGGETNYSQFESNEDSFLGLFGKYHVQDTADRSDRESQSF